jgi:dihydropteroate synthase
VVEDVRGFLDRQMSVAGGSGIPAERIALDPGIGFSKRAPQSLRVLQGLPRLTSLGRPLYIGVSRKSFLGRVTGRPVPVDDRLAAGLGATVAALALGGRIFRTHDVRETVDAIRTAEAILNPLEARLAEDDSPATPAPLEAR